VYEDLTVYIKSSCLTEVTNRHCKISECTSCIVNMIMKLSA